METRSCQNCKLDFAIAADDLLIYADFKVEKPTECPTCRRMRRLAFGNYSTLYQRTNNAPKGGQIISCYPEEAPFPVYDFDYYWSNKHHPEEYNLDFKEDEDFFVQFKKLSDVAPRPALSRDPSNVNSEYTNHGTNIKNCFYTFDGLEAENVDYSMWGLFTRNSQDILITLNCDRMYESVFPEHSYNSSFIYFSKNILNSKYLYDCRDCSDCIGCVNLRHKKFHVFNENVGEEEYKKISEKLKNGSFIEHEKIASKFWDMVKSQPIRGERNEHSVNSSGIYLVHTKNLKESIWCIESINGKWLEFTMKVRDSFDSSISHDSERLYNCSLSGRQSWSNICTVNGETSGNCQYSMDLSNCTDCFGCIGLSGKKFCVFNKQYTKGEYEKIIEKIKLKMRSDGAYGNFFPYSLSPFPYNASLAYIIYPKTKDEIASMGSYFSEPASNIPANTKIQKAENLPDSVTAVTAEAIASPVASQVTGRPFRIRDADLQFYQHQAVPLPHLHPYERMKKRFAIANNFIIEDCICEKCGIGFRGVLPSADYRTYCDACYSTEIN